MRQVLYYIVLYYKWVSEWVSSYFTAHKHNLGHLVPLQVKNQERKSNNITKWKQLTRIH